MANIQGTGSDKKDVQLSITEAIKPKDEKTKSNIKFAYVETYLDSKCGIKVAVPEQVLISFQITTNVTPDNVKLWKPKKKEGEGGKYVFKDKGIPPGIKSGNLTPGGMPKLAGKLAFLYLPPGVTVTKTIGKITGGSKSYTLKKLHMRFPGAMDIAPIMYFIKEGFGTKPSKVKIGQSMYNSTHWDAAELANLGDLWFKRSGLK